MDFADVLLITAAVLGGMLPVAGAALWLHYRRRIRELGRELRGPDQALETRMAAVEDSKELTHLASRDLPSHDPGWSDSKALKMTYDLSPATPLCTIAAVGLLLGNPRVEIAMMVTPDGQSRLELSRFLTPPTP